MVIVTPLPVAIEVLERLKVPTAATVELLTLLLAIKESVRTLPVPLSFVVLSKYAVYGVVVVVSSIFTPAPYTGARVIESIMIPIFFPMVHGILPV